MRVGIADHFGWAVVVSAGDDHAVADRRRIELVEPGVPCAPVHHDGKGLDDAAAATLVADVRASVAVASGAALDALAAALPEPIESVSIRRWPPDFPVDIAIQRVAPWEARADGVMYRQVLADVVRARRWELHLYDPKHVIARAGAVLGERADVVLHGPRARLGPPWTNDHRMALAATVLAR